MSTSGMSENLIVRVSAYVPWARSWVPLAVLPLRLAGQLLTKLAVTGYAAKMEFLA